MIVPNLQPSAAMPLARIYTQPHARGFMAVIHLEQPVEQQVVVTAAQQMEGGFQTSGERRTLALEFLANGMIMIVGNNRKHTPSLLLVKARLLAAELGHRTQVVAPPH